MSESEQEALRGPLVSSDEGLLRLVWDSDDLTEDRSEIATSAFSKRDLAGVDNGLSVDRTALANTKAIRQRVANQQKKAEGREDLNRDAALISECLAGTISTLKFEDTNAAMFAVISTPIPGDTTEEKNDAHAEIVNISGRNKGSDLNKMRTKLQSAFVNPTEMEIVLARLEATKVSVSS